MLVEKRIGLKNAIGNNAYNNLQVAADYQREQTNFANGKHEQGGIYVYIQPIKISRGFVSCTVISGSAYECGFKVFFHGMNRNNKKKVQKVGDLLTDNVLESIRENYEKQDFSKVSSIIRKLSENFQ